eukprot:TRINITY_DN71946_c0_g1_i1.p1 TRINITY_DN71946_c0_g1~~TRINITY_DN71946_c0_g1_i1.p1  ORF type:complete len:210 (+),score=11.53 TRINITY_DN71946_c0_g1_i1:62-631(+)
MYFLQILLFFFQLYVFFFFFFFSLQQKQINFTYTTGHILQGSYSANVKIYMNNPTSNYTTQTLEFEADMILFCNQLSQVLPESMHTIESLYFTKMDNSWPQGWGTQPKKVNQELLYFELELKFSHPVDNLEIAALTLLPGNGTFLRVTPTTTYGSKCSSFAIRGYVEYEPWEQQETKICVQIQRNQSVS